jgi:S-adenosyl methyltransferase
LVTSPIDTGVAHIARVYNYWLCGKDNFAADRELAEKFRQVEPEVIIGVRASRAFLGRAVRYLALAGRRGPRTTSTPT